jgi:hypothetical protein
MRPSERQFGYEGPVWIAYFWFVGWTAFSFGFHLCLASPNLEIHVPFGFIRIGFRRPCNRPHPHDGWRFFGFGPRHAYSSQTKSEAAWHQG